jgi:hypothetical protein
MILPLNTGLRDDYKEQTSMHRSIFLGGLAMRCVCLLGLLFVTGAALADDSREPTLISKPEAFQTLVNPKCSHCRDEAKRRVGELRDDDRVLCWIRGYSEGGAIPIRFFLAPYRVISDSYGVFVYDADAGFLRGFAPSYDFSFYGWRNGVMVMKHKDGTLYSSLTGLAFAGPKKGSRLKPIPTLVSDWSFWLKRYPGGVAYHMFDKFQPTEFPTVLNDDSRKTRPPVDQRLPADAVVLGVVDKDRAKAYPLDLGAKTSLVTDAVDGQRRVVLWYAPTKTAAAYETIASPPKKEVAPGSKAPPPPKNLPAPRTVTLEMDGADTEAPWVDRETHSRWDIAGRAVEGELKGWTLVWLEGAQVKWFAWAAEYPRTSIYGE